MANEDAQPSGRAMTIPVSQETTVSADSVLKMARDFSEQREAIFPAVSVRHMTVHALDDSTADVTEGTRLGPFVVWERCRYDWSTPGRVTATVTDSNVYGFPGSSWELVAVSTGSGARVDMTWTRWFQRRAFGRVMGFVYRHFGQRSFTKYAHDIVKNMEAIGTG